MYRNATNQKNFDIFALCPTDLLAASIAQISIFLFSAAHNNFIENEITLKIFTYTRTQGT